MAPVVRARRQGALDGSSALGETVLLVPLQTVLQVGPRIAGHIVIYAHARADFDIGRHTSSFLFSPRPRR
jgi:hypothetical protein